MGPHEDSPAGQDLLGDASGNAQGRRQPPGEVAPAPHVGVAAPLGPGGEIRVARPGLIGKLPVVLRVLVRVFYHGAQRRAAGLSPLQAGEEFRHVVLLPGGGEGARSRPPAVQEALELLQVNRLPGGEAVHHHADGLSVGLAEDADADDVSKLRGHGPHLPDSRNPARSWGRTFSPPPPPGW